ncbi:T9SS type A sorting domain-containing protein [Catalinimonas alkaloidigena]|nr:T9SS type A sorting domain-containing protein [Catalinimonas alkaloidigena]
MKKYLFWAVGLLLSGHTWAEGSKNLTPTNTSGATTGTNKQVGYLLHDAGANSNDFLSPGAPTNERLYVTVKPGETLYFGVQRAYSLTGFYNSSGSTFENRLRVRLKYDNGGTVVPYSVILNDDGTNPLLLDSTQAGVIPSYAKAAVGPNRTGVTNGYDPLSWTNNTGATRQVWVEFTTPISGGVNSDNDYTNNLSYYNLWDFTVIDNNGVEKTGRLYSSQWAFSTGNFDDRLSVNFSLYATMPADAGGYYVKKVNYAGMKPYEAIFVANGTGTTPTADYTEDRKSKNGTDGFTSTDIYPEYPLFVSNPDATLYPTASTQAVSTVATNSFCNALGEGSMSLNLNSSQAGIGIIFIDLDQDGELDPEDRLLEQPISAGNNYFFWDGQDGLGNPVPSGTEIQFEFRSNVTAVHFPIWDAETNDNGITVQKVRPGVNGEYEYLYYDDSNLPAGMVTPQTQLEGNNSVSGAHLWTDSDNSGTGDGDGRIMNTFTYGSIVTQIITKVHEYDCNPDYDGDGYTNDVDLDDDNDGIPDSDELVGLADPYGFDGASTTGYPRYLDYSLPGFIDYDANGIDDRYDTDGDGILSINDPDADGDGIFDAQEADRGRNPSVGGYDNATGTFSGTDADGNGMIDVTETAVGSGTTIFPLTNSDSDGLPDFLDVDSDNDGIADLYEGRANMDGSGGRNYRDTDADGDGLYDLAEAGGTDADNNGVVDTFTDLNNNGLADEWESLMGGTTLEPSDSDGDGQVNFLDLDSDNDGIPDGTEGATDLDGDGIANFIDLDSDNDGIWDVTEAGGTAGPDARLSGFTDGNGDGQDDTVAGTPLPLYNTDGVGNPDFLDADSDGDGIADVLEAGGRDANGDGQIDGTINANGLADAVDPTVGGRALPLPNTDGTGDADYRDTDSDGDGFADSTEGFDNNFDGTPDRTPSGSDTDGDGLDDAFDTDNGGVASTQPDLDGDGLPNYQDTDDDGDGTSSLAEGGGGSPIPLYLNNPGVNQFVIAPGSAAIQTGRACYQMTNGGNQRSAVWAADQVNASTSFVLEANLNFGNDAQNEGIAFVFQQQSLSALGDNGRSMGYGENNAGAGNSILPSLIIEFDIRDNGFNDPAEDHVGVMLNGDEQNHALTVNLGYNLEDGADHNFKVVNYTGLNEIHIFLDGVQILTGGALNTIITGDQYWGFTSSTSGGGATQSICDVSLRTLPDSDGDGLNDIVDNDDDNDGILDTDEGQGTDPSADADGDGIPNYQDTSFAGFTDANGDGVDDRFDADGDGIPNQLDLDSDNDGLADSQEGATDLDGDGLSSHLDRDSDGDGITDTRESGGNDANGDGVIDGYFDYDEDGLADRVDPSEGGTALTLIDSDGDGNPDHLDLDSDNDGIADVLEAGGTDDDQDGQMDGFVDADTDGLNDVVESTPLTLPDHDGDGLANYRDVDSDNDGITDGVENNLADADNNGRVDGFTDANGDGWHDAFLYNAVTMLDSDGDSVPDYMDLDTDNDGIPDAREAGETNGADGRVAGFVDANGDGRKDGLTLAMPDTDGDGILDYRDVDSDNDGLTDAIEAGGNDTNSDGRIDSFADNSPNGLADGYNDATAASPLPVPDTDSDGTPDYIDRDSDGDGLYDWIEAFDLNGNGSALDDYIQAADNYAAYSGDDYYPTDAANDADGDGVPDWLEDDNGDGIANFQDPTHAAYYDTDGNGLINLYDAAFGGIENNFNNAPDADGDGIPDWQEEETTTTLPVELVSLTAAQEDEAVMVRWTTMSETTNSHFDVERSLDGVVFEKIGQVKGQGTSLQTTAYAFADRNPHAGINYYRLRQVDYDGNATYYGPVAVQIDPALQWTAYPNPTYGAVTLEVRVDRPQQVEIELISLAGVRLWHQTRDLQGGMNQWTLEENLFPQPGVYLLRIKTHRSTQSLKLITY